MSYLDNAVAVRDKRRFFCDRLMLDCPSIRVAVLQV